MTLYQSLIEKAITTVMADFNLMMIYKDEKRRFIPPNTLVLIPFEYVGIVTMPNILSWYLGKDKKAKLTIKPPIPDGHKKKEHYLYQLHHGYDYSHHGESLESSMLIEKETLDALAMTMSDTRPSFPKTLEYYEALEHLYPKIVKLDESSIAWHDEELLTKVEAVK
jgi:hypothetical protein